MGEFETSRMAPRLPKIAGVPRERCWSCHRAQSVCLCAQIKPFTWEPTLAVLIHPKEFRKTIGTARLVKIALKNSYLWTGYGPDFDHHPELQALIHNPKLFPVVLFPGPKSTNLSQVPENELKHWIPGDRKLAIIVVDGSWSLARKMIHTSRSLRLLPQVSFDVEAPSHYRFRKQPHPYCLSTVEAIYHLIDKLQARGVYPEPQEHGHKTLLDTFNWLVAEQLKFNEISE